MTHLLVCFFRSVQVIFLAFEVLVTAGQAIPDDPPKGRYVFIEDPGRWVGVIRGEWYLIGKLDANGEFIHEYKFKRNQPLTLTAEDIINLLPGENPNPKKVYEFRSGMLIPGAIQKDGRFVPEAGGKIIPFKDYKYSPDVPPIWNLPGRFVTEEEAAKLKRPKPADKK